MSVNIWSNGNLVPIANSGTYVYNTPLGSIIAFSGNNIPVGFLLCDGSTLNKNEYLDLFNVIGYTYGGSDNEFKLPDLRECVLVGVGESERDIIKSTNSHDVYTLGEFKNDQLQNITGKYSSTDYSISNISISNAVEDGALYGKDYDAYSADGTSNNKNDQRTLMFDASRIARTGTTTHGKQVGVNYIIKATNFVSNIQANKPFAICNSLIDEQNKVISIPNLINVQPGTEISVLFTNGNSYGSCVGTDSNIIADAVKLALNNGTPYPIKVGGENAGEGFCRAGDVHKFVFDGSAWNDLTADVIYKGETKNGNYVKKRNGLIEQEKIIKDGSVKFNIPFSNSNYIVNLFGLGTRINETSDSVYLISKDNDGIKVGIAYTFYNGHYTMVEFQSSFSTPTLHGLEYSCFVKGY